MEQKSIDVVVTGVGIVTSLGVGVDAHLEILRQDHVSAQIDDDIVAPYPVHKMPEIDWSAQIPRRGDQRQMGNWQRLGVFAAGLALEDAGFKDDLDACGSMDMIIAAGGGERDLDVDDMIIKGSMQRNDKDVLLNETLRTELRPTLFLSQLSNLLAGNISIVHKVTGSSRTFMGEEGSGVSAFETAFARIKSGKSTHCLVGAAYVGEREDSLMFYEAINQLEKSPARPFWQRAQDSTDDSSEDRGGMILGSAGAFLILEAREHAEARGAKIYAQLDDVRGDAGSRDRESFDKRATQLSEDLPIDTKDGLLVISGASGAKEISDWEKSFLEREFSDSAVRTTSAAFGHTIEAQFPLGLALASLAISQDAPVGTFAKEFDQPMTTAAEQAIVTCFGHNHSEGMASLSKV